MSDANLRDKAQTGAVVRSPASRIPTTGPHPIPGGEYDRDGFLYRLHVENIGHERIRTELSSVLRAYMRRRHGPRALVAADVGLYARRADRFGKPLAPDILPWNKRQWERSDRRRLFHGRSAWPWAGGEPGAQR